MPTVENAMAYDPQFITIPVADYQQLLARANGTVQVLSAVNELTIHLQMLEQMMRPAQTEWIATALAVEKYKVSSRTLYSCKKQGFMTTKKIGSITTWSVAELDSRFKKRTS